MTFRSVTTVDRSGGKVTIAITGDIDIANAGLVSKAIVAAFDGRGVGQITVDLAGVPFLDAAGISLLVNGRTQADERGVRFQVINPNNFIRRLLYLAGVLEWLVGFPGQS